MHHLVAAFVTTFVAALAEEGLQLARPPTEQPGERRQQQMERRTLLGSAHSMLNRASRAWSALNKVVGDFCREWAHGSLQAACFAWLLVGSRWMASIAAA